MKTIGFWRSNRIVALVAVLAAVVAAAAWLQLSSFRRYTVRLANSRGMPLRVIVFEPLPAGRAMPAVLVCSPATSPPEAGNALLLEFARRGMLAVTLDSRGQAPGESRALLREDMLTVTALDAAAALNYVANRPDVDRHRIGLIGHSAGGTLAIRAGIEQPWVRATIPLGIAGDVTRELPQNVLWLVGLYDEFRPLLEMQQVMEASNAEAVAVPGRTAGDLARGTARRLEVTATADHFTEMLNHGTAVRAVEWFESAFNGRAAARPRFAAAPIFYAAYSLAFLCGWLAIVSELVRRGIKGRAFTRLAVIFALVLVFAPLPRASIFRADLMAWLLAATLLVNAGLDPTRAVRLGALGWLSYLLTLIVNQTAYFWRYPHLLYALPAFPFWHATGLLNQYFFIYARGVLFSSYTGAVLQPRWAVAAVFIAELARPGVVLGSVGRVLSKMRRPAGTPAKRTNWAAAAFALLLFLALGAVLALRSAQGFVDRESLLLAGWVILRFALLPFLIFALLRRIGRQPARHQAAAHSAG